MTKKLLVLDLDGTLLTDDKTVTVKTSDAIKNAVKDGHKVMIASGRPLASARRCAKKYLPDVPGSLLIAMNGGILYDLDHEKVLSRKTMDLGLVQTLFDLADEYGQYIHTYSDDKVLTRREAPQIHQYIQLTGLPYECREDCPRGIERPPKVLLSNLEDHDALARFKQVADRAVNGRCLSFFSTPEYLEYTPLDSTKGHAMLDAAKLLEIAREDTIAVGNEENDLSMIEMAGVGVAMSNSNPGVLKKADYITKADNNHDGIAEVITKFM
ncbi:MAG: Cof-type HAD-IIB family hydrolase [Eubacterium sp.]|nr:Cof-type HAD-IIB family hydrolase [Eubacterium sp.]